MFRVLILKDKMGDLSDKIFSLRWSNHSYKAYYRQPKDLFSGSLQ